MRKLLVVNSNTSAAATDRIAAGCAARVGSETRVRYVNATAGPQGIDTRLDVALSAVETVRVVAQHRDDFDAFVVACGLDPGLDAARQVTDKPVLGIAEAGMLVACTLGATFSVLVPLRAQVTAMKELVDHYGLRSRLASVRPVEMTTAELIGGRERLTAQLVTVARLAVEEDLAEVVVLTGSVMGGLEDELTPEVGVPVVSGMVCAIKLAEALIDLRVHTSHRYTYRTVTKHDRLTGYADFQEVYSAE
jgi:allantoin racemase